jgi:hypothetical protein
MKTTALVTASLGLVLLAATPLASADPPTPCFDVPSGLENPGLPAFARPYSDWRQTGVIEWYLQAWHFQGYCSFNVDMPTCFGLEEVIALNGALWHEVPQEFWHLAEPTINALTCLHP